MKPFTLRKLTLLSSEERRSLTLIVQINRRGLVRGSVSFGSWKRNPPRPTRRGQDDDERGRE
jgi:hypothetical protein